MMSDMKESTVTTPRGRSDNSDTLTKKTSLKNQNPLLSASVIGLTFEDFPNKPQLLLPASPPAPSAVASVVETRVLEPKSLVTVGPSLLGNEIERDLDEINLNAPSEEKSYSGNTNIDPFDILNSNIDPLSHTESILSQAASSFSALPAVASSVFSTVSKRIYTGSNNRERTQLANSNLNSNTANTGDHQNQQQYSDNIPSFTTPVTTSALYNYPSIGEPLIQSKPIPPPPSALTTPALVSQQFLASAADLPKITQTEQQVPKFYTPADVPSQHTVSDRLPVSNANSYRLTAKKKLYAQIPGLSNQGNFTPVVLPAHQSWSNSADDNYHHQQDQSPQHSCLPTEEPFQLKTAIQPSVAEIQSRSGISGSSLFSTLTNFVPTGVLQNITGLVQSATGTSIPPPTEDQFIPLVAADYQSITGSTPSQDLAAPTLQGKVEFSESFYPTVPFFQHDSSALNQSPGVISSFPSTTVESVPGSLITSLAPPPPQTEFLPPQTTVSNTKSFRLQKGTRLYASALPTNNTTQYVPPLPVAPTNFQSTPPTSYFTPAGAESLDSVAFLVSPVNTIKPEAVRAADDASSSLTLSPSIFSPSIASNIFCPIASETVQSEPFSVPSTNEIERESVNTDVTHSLVNNTSIDTPIVVDNSEAIAFPILSDSSIKRQPVQEDQSPLSLSNPLTLLPKSEIPLQSISGDSLLITAYNNSESAKTEQLNSSRTLEDASKISVAVSEVPIGHKQLDNLTSQLIPPTSLHPVATGYCLNPYSQPQSNKNSDLIDSSIVTPVTLNPCSYFNPAAVPVNQDCMLTPQLYDPKELVADVKSTTEILVSTQATSPQSTVTNFFTTQPANVPTSESEVNYFKSDQQLLIDTAATGTKDILPVIESSPTICSNQVQPGPATETTIPPKTITQAGDQPNELFANSSNLFTESISAIPPLQPSLLPLSLPESAANLLLNRNEGTFNCISFFDTINTADSHSQVKNSDNNSTDQQHQHQQSIQNFFNNPSQKINPSGQDLNYNLVHHRLDLDRRDIRCLTPASNTCEPPSSACSEIVDPVVATLSPELTISHISEHIEAENIKHYEDLPEEILKELRMANMVNEINSTSPSQLGSMIYEPCIKHWFFKRMVGTKLVWMPFSHYDSALLETSLHYVDDADKLSSPTNKMNIIAVEGGRYDVNVAERTKVPIYWEGEPIEVRRCSWFYKAVDNKYVPYEENIADLLESEYKTATQSGVWHKKIMLSQGDQVVFHGPTIIVHFQQLQNSDSWGGTSQTTTRPRVVKRDLDDFTIDQGEEQRVDHLLFMVHGIGAACDLKMRSVEEVVDDFRSIAQQLVQSHYKNSSEMGLVGRVEVLPISWHGHLHSEEMGIDEKLKSITLESIPKLRNFTNSTLLDVLFYTSPTFCQKIMNTVAASMNQLYVQYRQRNPNFNGGVSLAGHSLGSLILFDLLCHQTPVKEMEDENMEDPDQQFLSNATNAIETNVGNRFSYTMGPAGTGQPFIHYGQLIFQPKKFFALGSPIGMFATIRGIDKLGLDFRLPTCAGFYNIFHPFDPVAYRIEALVNPDMSGITPVLIPHHKGRKRMHLELKDTMTRVGADLKQRFFDTFKNTFESMNFLGVSTKSKQEAEESMEKEVDKVIELQMQIERRRARNRADGSGIGSPDESDHASTSHAPSRSPANSTSTAFSDQEMVEIDLPLGKLNDSKRIDYVLQEAPLEFFNEYLFALSSHVCYWESEDTILFVMKEIYTGLGISPDSQVPAQTMTIERPSSGLNSGPSSQGVSSPNT